MVISDHPCIYSSSVATNVVKNLLLRIGIFAIDGIIFRIHGDRDAAVRDVRYWAGNSKVGSNSKFENGPNVQAQSQPSTEREQLASPLPRHTAGGHRCCLCVSPQQELRRAQQEEHSQKYFICLLY